MSTWRHKLIPKTNFLSKNQTSRPNRAFAPIIPSHPLSIEKGLPQSKTFAVYGKTVLRCTIRWRVYAPLPPNYTPGRSKLKYALQACSPIRVATRIVRSIASVLWRRSLKVFTDNHTINENRLWVFTPQQVSPLLIILISKSCSCLFNCRILFLKRAHKTPKILVWLLFS